ncbi:MarR family winged helix-turn-helix transcriptional regulator [Novosphingobium sp.]|uniref:MarR family winged helix-turn-helix transcriptional regulator n=1 Tax=Novosphingobium sp. TaxID=1874826 RepID=UPI0035AE7BCA
MNDPLLDLPGYALRRAAGAMMAEFSRRLEPLGLRYADVSALLLIGANPTLTASQLGRMLDIQRANMVPLLGRLTDAGLITRRPLDGKSHSLHLTDAGEVKLAEARRVIEQFESWLVARIPPAHRDHLKPALDALWRD